MARISEETISTWMTEFNRVADGHDEDGSKSFEWLLRRQAKFVSQEPTLLAFLSVIMDRLKCQNPITGAVFALSIYNELRAQQDAADKLTQEMQ